MRQFLCSENFVRRSDQQRHNFQTMKQMNAKYAGQHQEQKQKKNNAFLRVVPLFRLPFFLFASEINKT